jgi:hypothetical protein
MLKKYKNELLYMIKEQHYPISDFIATEPESPDYGITFRLVHKPTDFQFVVWNEPGDFDSFGGLYTDFVPGLKNFYFPEYNPYCNINEVLVHCINWLRRIEKYNEDLLTPDLWTNITDSQNLINETDIESLEYFTTVEKESVLLAIRDLKQLIEKKFEMDDTQKAIVSERLNYLAEEVHKSNKFNWKGILLNTIINISITLSLDAEKGRQLFELSKAVFGSIVRLLH